MGTTYQNVDKSTNLRDYVQAEYGGQPGVYDYSVVGGNAYLLCGHPGRLGIVVVKLSKHTDEYGLHIGTKPIDESSHPYYYDCPLRLLDKADPPVNDDAARWREEVRRRASARNRVRRIKDGERIKLAAPLNYGFGSFDTFEAATMFYRGHSTRVYRIVAPGKIGDRRLVRISRLHTREFEVLEPPKS
ncbi:MAG: hypothetical protein CMK32_09740 [Porticoccaceae bacterium]|nr:hypothetical protein [Porticoccaceae bacterium]|tara:strand:- start:23 stop:586 length:564 start_codon:yes stop_codon:yes gene_type:complete